MVGKYRVYLSAQHRYYGLPHPGEVLPLWIYEGELAPEFITEKDSWKFYDRLPVAVFGLSSLPLEILEHIYQMAGMPLPADHKMPGAPAPAATPGATPELPPLSEARDHYLPEKETKKEAGWGGLVSFIKKKIIGD